MRNDNYNCLPFYSSINEQNQRKNYAYGDIYPLYAPNDRLLSFQLARPHLDTSVWDIQLVSMNDPSLNQTLTPEIVGASGWYVADSYYTDPVQGAMDIIVCSPYTPMASIRMPEGRYYVTIDDGTNQWWSDVFTVVNDLSSYTRIQWRNLTDLQLASGGAIIYEGLGFTRWNTLYFAEELGKPEYPFDEEGENRDGWFFAEKQISSKTYKFFPTAPEYLCDCLRLVRMADEINIRDGYGREYPCDTFVASPQWQEQGDIALVTIEFSTATVVKHIGNGRPYLGDYNIDYNDDYDINN